MVIAEYQRRPTGTAAVFPHYELTAATPIHFYFKAPSGDQDAAELERALFPQLAERWERATQLYSSPRQAKAHPAYRDMLAMGRTILPLVFERLRQNPGHWFLLLHEITGANPVQPGHEGHVRSMVEDWLAWRRSPQEDVLPTIWRYNR